MTSKKHGCTCDKCKECCRREAGWFLPDEVAIAASYLSLSEDEFVAKHCEEHIEDNVSAISPATKSTAGRPKTKPGSTECVFLDGDGLCKIHDVKPYECRKVFGCEPPSRHRRIREMIKKQWR